MKFIKLIARFDAPDIGLAEELICDIFFDFNLKGVVCDVPLEEPDEGFGTHTLPKPDHFSIIGFFPLMDASKVIIKTIEQKTKELSRLNIDVIVSSTIVDEKEWANAWKDYFEVTPITDKIIVKPEWKPYTPKEGELLIHLDPGMAFGTGTHPTTAMCIQLIQKYLSPGHTFLDIGTGSGILMIAAARLGADHMTGIDTDDAAVGIAGDNLTKNQIDEGAYNLACTTIDKAYDKKYHIIAANIIAQVIVDITKEIAQRMNPDTIAILSGIIKERMPDVQMALDTHSLVVTEKITTDEWVALAVKKQP